MITPIVFLKPTKIEFLSKITQATGGTDFWISAKFDRTAFTHALATFFSILHPIGAILYTTAGEIADGIGSEACVENGCKQGFDLIDWAPTVVLSVLWWIFLPSFLSF